MSMERMLKKGELLAIRKDGKIASIIAMRENFFKWPDGRDCYEIGKAATLPEYEGQGLYKTLAAEAEKQLKEKYPEAPIIRGTKNPRVKNHLRNEGWKEIPISYGMNETEVSTESMGYKIAKRYRDLIDTYSPTVTKRWIRDGYSIFYFDPGTSGN
jgi:GNAT superfamily N-acetyltransferase